MTRLNWLDRLLGRTEEEPERAVLDQQQSRIATRLSKLTGKGRDDVLAEAYRLGDIAMRDRKR